MESIDLSVNFAGLQLKNPLIVTAGDATRKVWQLKEAEDNGASAVIIKAISIDPVALRSKPRFHIAHNSIFGFGGSKRLNPDDCERLIKDAKEKVKIPLGVNIIFSRPENLNIYLDIANKMQKAGADFLEINFFPPTMKNPEARYFPELIYDGVNAIKKIAYVPVITKLTPVDIDVIQAALAMESGGADAIHAIDAVSGSPQIDITHNGQLVMKGTKNSVLWLSGEYLRPIAQATVIKIARTVKIPVLGTGGLMNWNHAVEMIMFGATATGTCTNVMIHGFEVIKHILNKIAEYMRNNGYVKIDDFKGLALKNMLTHSTDVDIINVVAKIDKNLCNGCGLCTKPAHCGLDERAITMIDNIANVNTKQCLGCATCYNVCPTHAIAMV